MPPLTSVSIAWPVVPSVLNELFVTSFRDVDIGGQSVNVQPSKLPPAVLTTPTSSSMNLHWSKTVVLPPGVTVPHWVKTASVRVTIDPAVVLKRPVFCGSSDLKTVLSKDAVVSAPPTI